jgi:hypothetical protein
VPTRSSLRTSTKCTGSVSSDACSAKAKQACPRDRSALSEVVRRVRLLSAGGDTGTSR